MSVKEIKKCNVCGIRRESTFTFIYDKGYTMIIGIQCEICLKKSLEEIDKKKK